ncbi:peptidase inhibitor family I36 protein [Streptomyces chilikensis]|uniref:Peptidase inhibitor family I36 protein n=1 Tax=Streptomyces chilikensis TaxID=1194079 RepID=A0ABV3EJ03_9ACTN
MAVTAQSTYALTPPGAQASGSWRAFSQSNYTGLDTTFSGDVGQCRYVGDNWNDKVRSAKSSSATTRVELWEHSNCTGYAITIDGSGYYNIGAWVSGYKVTAP